MTFTSATPSVSVVIPTRGRPELLRTAVTAVLAQEYAGEVECVVVHDGEDPAPGERLVAGTRRVLALRNDRSPGAAGARNCGLTAATGDLVGLCDDDDVWLPGKLTAQVERLSAAPGAIGCGGGFVLRQGSRTTVKTPSVSAITHAGLLRSRLADVHPSTLLFHRARLLAGAGLFDEEVPGSYGEDYDWLLRATRLGEVVVLPQPMAEVLWHSGSFFAGQWDTISRAILYLLDKHPDLSAEPRGAARLYGRLAFAQAALGDRAGARRWALRSLRKHPGERRAYVALAAGAGLLPPRLAMRLANAAGKGL